MVGHWLLGVCPLSILALVLLVLNAFMASFTAAKVRSEEYGQPSHPWLCGVPQLQQPGIATSSVVWSREETCFDRNKVSHSIPKFTAERNYH